MARPKCTIPHGYVVVILSFLGMLITVGFRESFAVIVTHISSNASAIVDGDSIFSNCTAAENGNDLHVTWSGPTGQLLHTAFFLGQLVTSIPSGALTATLCPKRVMGWTLLTTSVLFLVLSEARKAGLWLIFTFRAVQGVVEGMAVPSMNAIISRWARPQERARLINIAYAGVYLSPAVASFASGATICYVSWDSIMYITGSFGVVWGVVWLLVIKPSPETVDSERQRLLRQLPDEEERPKTNAALSMLKLPWKSFFTSMPVLAIWIASFCRNFIFAMLISEVPQYLKDSYGLPTAMIGLLSATPHICMVVFMSFGSVIFDKLYAKRVLSLTWTRKLAQFTGYGVQGGCTLAIAFVDDHIIACILLCIGAAFSGFAISGFQTNPLDLAPEYAGPLTGISRTGMLGAVVSTTLASQLPGKQQNLKSWQTMFLIGGILHLAGVLFYLVFASGERQPWAPAKEETRDVPQDEAVYDDHFLRQESRPEAENNRFGEKPSARGYGGCGAVQVLPTGAGHSINGTTYDIQKDGVY